MKKFAKLRDKNIIIHNIERTFDERYEMLKPGVYEVRNYAGTFEPTIYGFNSIDTPDSLIQFKEGVVDETIKKLSSFFNNDTKSLYAEMKIAHKVGCILYGPPGTGKTSTVYLIMKQLSEKMGCICINGTGQGLKFLRGAIKLLRDEGFTGPICLFQDEVEDCFDDNLNSYLTFLDGSDSIEGLIFIGCTNEIDSIPEKIKYRKSRIKYLIEVNRFPDAVYEHYIQEKIPSLSKSEISEIAYHAGEAGLTIDQLKHVLIDYRIEKVNLEEAIKSVKKIITN